MSDRRTSTKTRAGQFTWRGKVIQWQIRRPKTISIWNCQIWVKLLGEWDQVWYAMHRGNVRKGVLRHINSHKNYERWNNSDSSTEPWNTL